MTFDQKKQVFLNLKEKSGSHSPSISTLYNSIPDLKIDVDACFLSNPYATNLFFDFFDKKLIKSGKIRDVIEFYPAQNKSIAIKLEKTIGIDHNNILICNGAIEGIQAVLHRFVKDSIVVPLPTFSSYYEFTQNINIKCFKYQTKKESNYKLDLDDYSNFIKNNKIRNCVIINPNNPDGNHIEIKYLIDFFEKNTHLDNIILDESFVHFTYDKNLNIQSLEKFAINYKNLVIIKSLSKDFGIAGIRAGYLIMDKIKIKDLLTNGYLWNSNGIAEFFFDIYSDDEFLNKYKEARLKYLEETNKFYKVLCQVKNIHVIESKANFFLLEIKNGNTSSEMFMKLLFNNNIYVRDCSDKEGLLGQYIRIASRTTNENELILKSLIENV